MLNAVVNASSATGSDISALGNGREDLAQASLQQVRQIGSEQDGDEDRGADDGHRQKHMEGRLRGELDHHGLPVGRGKQRAAFEQQLQAQISFNYSSP